MRFFNLTMLLALAGGLAFGTACTTGGSKDTDAGDNVGDDDDDDDDDDTTDSASDGDTALALAAWIGDGVFNGPNWDGVHIDMFLGIPTETVLCELGWEASGIRPSAATAACVDSAGTPCEFSMDYNATNGMILEESRCDEMFDGPPILDDFGLSVAHHPNYVYNGTEYGALTMIYLPANPPNRPDPEWFGVGGYSEVDGNYWTFVMVVDMVPYAQL